MSRVRKLLKSAKRETRTVELELSGLKVEVRSMSAGQSREVLAASRNLTRVDDGNPEWSEFYCRFAALVLASSVVDPETGVLICETEEDAEAFEQLPAADHRALVEACLDVSGLGGPPDEGESKATPSSE